MSFRHLALAGLLACIASPLLAEGLKPPKELPPAGFKGEQYVDSAGCVFLRAGVGERVTWVARISRERRQMCGLAPTFAPVVAEAAPPSPAEPDVEAVAVPAPVPESAAATKTRLRRAAPEIARAVATPAQEVQFVNVICPAHAPVAKRLAVKGATKILCFPEGMELDTVAVPKGYRLAWTDDRLNPLRGIGTAEGEVMQDRVWTRKVPARPVAEATPPVRVQAPVPAKSTARKTSGATLSASNAPAQASGHYLVQVGSFGVAANAHRTRERLAVLGLPVTGGKGSINGQPVHVVYAGPFSAADAAQAALRLVRGAGFGDAFLR